MSSKKKSSLAKNGHSFTFDTEVGETVTGRQSNSSLVFSVYRQILDIEALNGTATFDMVLKAMKRNSTTKIDEKRLRNEVKLAVKDRLLRSTTNILKIDRSRRCALNKSDVYCFNCFTSGEQLTKCNNCYRVYHTKCFGYCDIRGKCFFCKNYPQEPIRQKVPTGKELSKVLLILHNKLKKEHSEVVDASNYVNENDSLVELVSNFIHLYDSKFDAIERKIKSESYESVMQYIFDCKQIIFNINVLYGTDSDLAKKAKQMEEFILSEEHIIHNCIDCYLNLSKKSKNDTGDWFLLPCNPPHQLCFVQVVGFPYYPAKVVEASEEETFVKFFDENRETARTLNCFIRPRLPIDTQMTDELKQALAEYEVYNKASEDQQNPSQE